MKPILWYLVSVHWALFQSEPFYDRVLSDFRRNSYFIALDIESDRDTCRVVIENDDLFEYLRQTKGFNERKYKTFMKDVLTKKKRMSISPGELKRWDFTKVIQMKNPVSTNNQADFIQHYFKGRVLKNSATDNEQYVVISNLFHWQMATWIDDESGYVVRD